MISKFAIGCLVVATVLALASATGELTVVLPALAAGAALPALALPAFAPLVATVGGVTYTWAAADLAVGAAAIAGLAIAKSALALAAINDKKKTKRSATNQPRIDFAEMFESIVKQDVGDCGKMTVCHAFAKPEHKRSGEEKLIVNLFDDLTVIQPNAYGKYQWAAYAGTFRNPTICTERYAKCKLSAEALGNIISVQ